MRWQLPCYRGSLMMMGVIDPRLTSCCQGQAPGIRQTRQLTRTLGGGQQAHRPRPPAEVPRGRGHRQAGAGSGYKEAAPLGQVSVQQVVRQVSPRCPPRCRWPRWFYVSMRGSLRFPQPSCSRGGQVAGKVVRKVFSCRLSPQELLAVHTRWGRCRGRCRCRCRCRVSMTVQAVLAGHGGLGRLGVLGAGQGGPLSPQGHWP